MKKISILLLSIVFGLGLVSPVCATGTTSQEQPESATLAPHNTFREVEQQNTSELWFGQNLMVAGSATSLDEVTVKGLLFGFGSQVQFDGTVRSDYTFIASNVVDYSATSEKDLFVAAATINLKKGAHIGRDVYAAASVVNVETDLAGDLSIAAAEATLRDVKIAGNVNLSVGKLVIEGNVVIGGKISVNDDALIIGLDRAKYAEVEKYTHIDYEPTAAELWVSKLYSVVALFVVFGILLAFYPRLNRKVDQHLTSANFGIDVIMGCVALVLVPVLIIFLAISLIGAPAALILLALYVVMLYLAQGFAGFWLGKLVVEKIAKSQTHYFVEALLGITLLGCISLIPFVGWIVGLWSTVLGSGLIIQCIRPRKEPVEPSNHQLVAAKNTKTTKSKTAKTSKAKSTKN